MQVFETLVVSLGFYNPKHKNLCYICLCIPLSDAMLNLLNNWETDASGEKSNQRASYQMIITFNQADKLIIMKTVRWP